MGGGFGVEDVEEEVAVFDADHYFFSSLLCVCVLFSDLKVFWFFRNCFLKWGDSIADWTEELERQKGGFKIYRLLKMDESTHLLTIEPFLENQKHLQLLLHLGHSRKLKRMR